MTPNSLNLTPIARGILADLEAGKLTSPAIIAKRGINSKTFYKWLARFRAAGLPFQTPRTPPTFTPERRRRWLESRRRASLRYWQQVRAGKRPKPGPSNLHYGERPGEAEVVRL